MAYTQARKSKTKGTRYVGYYLDADGKPKVAGTFASDDEALRVAWEQEDHVRDRRTGTPPAEKATITIEEFAKSRFLPRIEITPKLDSVGNLGVWRTVTTLSRQSCGDMWVP